MFARVLRPGEVRAELTADAAAPSEPESPLAALLAAKTRTEPLRVREAIYREGRDRLAAVVADESLDAEARRSAALDLARLQTEAGRFHAARRALNYALSGDGASTDAVPADLEDLQTRIQQGIAQARLRNEFRRVTVQAKTIDDAGGLKNAATAVSLLDDFITGHVVSEPGREILDMARERKSSYLVHAAKIANRRGQKNLALALARDAVETVSEIELRGESRTAVAARFNAAQAHLLLANDTRSRKTELKLARDHGAGLRPVRVAGVAHGPAVSRTELSAFRRHLRRVQNQERQKLPHIRLTGHVIKAARRTRERLGAFIKGYEFRHKTVHAAVIAGAAAMLLSGTAFAAGTGAIPSPLPSPPTQTVAHNKPAPAFGGAKQLPAPALGGANQVPASAPAPHIKTLREIELDERAVLQQQLDEAQVYAQEKTTVYDSLTGPEMAAKIAREAGIRNRVLAVQVMGAESDWRPSGASSPLETNGTHGLGIFQISYRPKGYFGPSDPGVNGDLDPNRLLNDPLYNAQIAQERYLGPDGGEFYAWCSAFPGGAGCGSPGPGYLAGGAHVNNYRGTAEWAVASETEKYNEMAGAIARVNALQVQINALDAKLPPPRGLI